jgi:hypothetical protein
MGREGRKYVMAREGVGTKGLRPEGLSLNRDSTITILSAWPTSIPAGNQGSIPHRLNPDGLSPFNQRKGETPSFSIISLLPNLKLREWDTKKEKKLKLTIY